MLESIIPSRTRRKVLELFFHHPAESYYLRKIVREIDEEVNAVKREVDILEKAKLLNKEKRLNKVFYSLDKGYALFDEFTRIFTKTDTLSTLIYKNLSKLGKVKFMAISTKYSKRVPIKEDEVYLMAIGVIVLPELTAIIDEVEKEFGREINYTVMAQEEFIFRKRNNDPFLWRFLKQPKVMLVGQEEELLK